MRRWAPTVLLLTGCGPVQSSTLIVDAAAELAAAKTAQADEKAPFEYVAAEAYLHKAREEQSYSDFEISVIYARKSRDCARVARMLAEASTREAMGTTRATHVTKAKCRPGPERLIPIPDPAEEAAALQAKKLMKKQGKRPAPPPPAKQPPPEKSGPPEPSDPLPEGDAE